MDRKKSRSGDGSDARRIESIATATILLLLAAAVANAQAVAAPGAQAGAEGAASFAHPDLVVSPDALSSELGTSGLIVLDARPASAYRLGHIPGAVNLPVHSLDRTVTLSNGATVPSIVKPASEITPLLDATGISSGDRVVIYAQGFDIEATRLFWVLDYLWKA